MAPMGDKIRGGHLDHFRSRMPSKAIRPPRIRRPFSLLMVILVYTNSVSSTPNSIINVLAKGLRLSHDVPRKQQIVDLTTLKLGNARALDGL